MSLCYEVLPQIREFYRLSTTVINAYMQPVMASYLGRLENRMREMGVITPKLYIMQSNGGVSTFKGSAEKPVATVLSGPAGGVIASMGTCERVGINNIITFDMGGASCDVALIHEGQPGHHHPGKINCARSPCRCSTSTRSAPAAHHRAHRRGGRPAGRSRQRRRRPWAGLL